MRALVLEKERSLALRDIDLPLDLGPRDVKIAVDTVGICGSDVHYYTHGRIGSFIVKSPMVLGHEAAGTIVEAGSAVKGLKVGDRVCMEPGVPDMASRASRMGLYNVDPNVTFWATPPVHGCLTAHVIHPEAFTFKLPDNVSFAEGALVEPFAIGMQAAAKAQDCAGRRRGCDRRGHDRNHDGAGGARRRLRPRDRRRPREGEARDRRPLQGRDDRSTARRRSPTRSRGSPTAGARTSCSRRAAAPKRS